jgi:hypothetical protein
MIKKQFALTISISLILIVFVGIFIIYLGIVLDVTSLLKFTLILLGIVVFLSSVSWLKQLSELEFG